MEKQKGQRFKQPSTVEIQYIMCKTLQPQSHYRIVQDIYTCRETMNTTQWKPSSQLYCWTNSSKLSISPFYNGKYQFYMEFNTRINTKKKTINPAMNVKFSKRRSHFLPRNCPIRASHRPHLCSVTPLYFELPLENPVLWRRRICTNSSLLKLLICKNQSIL